MDRDRRGASQTDIDTNMNHAECGGILRARYWLSKILHADGKLTDGSLFIMRNARQYEYQSKFYSILFYSIMYFILKCSENQCYPDHWQSGTFSRDRIKTYTILLYLMIP